MSFKEVTKPMRVALHADMKEVLQADIHPPIDQLHGMMQYHMGWLNEQLEPDSAPAGKQIRPLLTMLCCQAAGGDWTQSIPAASAIELTHNFSLIHDDIEDDSPTRRGRATLWKIFGVPLAINAGDGMFAALPVGTVLVASYPPAVIPGHPAEVVIATRCGGACCDGPSPRTQDGTGNAEQLERDQASHTGLTESG